MAEPGLELLQAMVQRVLDVQTRHTGEFQQVKQRQTALERQLVGVRRDAASDAEATLTVQQQVDHLGQRLERVERRLDLVE